MVRDQEATCDRVNLSRRPEVEHHASSDLLEALTFTLNIYTSTSSSFRVSMSQRNQSKQRHADPPSPWLPTPGVPGGHKGVPKPGEIYPLQHVVGLPRGLLMVGHGVI